MCCVSIIEIEKLCKENTECKAEQAYVRNQKPVPMIPQADKCWGQALSSSKNGANPLYIEVMSPCHLLF